MKIPVSITDSEGVATGKTAYVTARLSSLASSEFAVLRAPIDGYTKTATVVFEREERKYIESFDETVPSTAGHTKEQETSDGGTTNNYMKISKSASFGAFSHKLNLNPKSSKFTTGLRLRFPNSTGFSHSDNKYLSLQFNSTNNTCIVQLSIVPIESITPLNDFPGIKDITDCGIYQYEVSALGTDKTATLTLTVIEKAYSIGKPCTDENTGHVVVPVLKAATDTKPVSLVTAIYENGRLTDIGILPVSGSGDVLAPIKAKDGAVVKTFLFESSLFFPLCEKVVGNPPEVTPVSIEEYDIVCWGDSLTYGQTEESVLPMDHSFPSYLAEISGKAVKNMGIGGETAQTIAARQGGLTIAPSGPFTLGVAAGSTVTFTEGTFDDLTGGHIVPRQAWGYAIGWQGVCYLNGIPVGVSGLKVDSSATPRRLVSISFKRLENGEELTVNEGERRILTPAGNMIKGESNVILIGENGWHDIDADGDTNELDLTLIIDSMIENFENPEKTIVLGLSTGSAESRKDMEALMLSK